jgi:cathepsin L
MKDYETGAAFSEFMIRFDKTYATQEETLYRYRVFAENYRKINEFNADPEQTSTVEVNMFADLTDEEFEKIYLPRTIATGSEIEEDYIPSSTNLKIDWQSFTTPVKDQGMCGSCWTFSSISVVETLIAINQNTAPVSYSEQELVDCCTGEKYKNSNGCNGGEDADALDYITHNGTLKSSDYPYYAIDKACTVEGLKHIEGIKGQKNITNLTEMEKAIKEQTISAGIAAGHVAFRFYKSGIVTKGCPGDKISHAVTVVGADEEGGIPYWKIRNSWGPNWGDHGHIRLMRSTKCGTCGVNCYSRVPIYGTKSLNLYSPELP